MKEKKSTPEKKNTKAIAAVAAVEAQPMNPRTFQEIGLTQIRINPLNPRKNFSGPKYDELLASVRLRGVIVPVLLRPLSDNALGPVYEIIAGERRWRASCEAAKENGGVDGASIPAIVQEMSDDDAYDCMTVENLQRVDLTPLEEARAFKLYLDRKGPESLPDLAERIGINPCYIRRRTAVLGLREEILKAWEEGHIAHGHLEQLVRVSDPKEQEEFFEDLLHMDMSVKHLKERIESRTPKLSAALFAKPLCGCLTCPQNTDVQRSLFGEGIATKALCLNPDCFKKHQGEWIQANWLKFKSSRKLETNGARFRDDGRYNEYENIYNLREKCKACEHCQSIISLDGKVDHDQACFGSKQCHNALYRLSSAAAKKEADPNAPRVSWHGEFFREEFFKTRIPELTNTLPPDDEKVLRILLLSIIETHGGASDAFAKKQTVNKENRSSWGYDHSRKSWPVIESLQGPELRSILQELSLLILMDPRTITPPTRFAVGVHLGSDLSTEWRMTKEYLDKKTTKEIHKIADQFGIFKDEKARSYLTETLGKKPDRFDLCKKGELVKIVLESGVDLAGKVPSEILSQA